MAPTNPIAPKGGYNNVSMDFLCPITANGPIVFLANGNSSASDFGQLDDDKLYIDEIAEWTSANGVLIDGVRMKDNEVRTSAYSGSWAVPSITANGGTTVGSISVYENKYWRDGPFVTFDLALTCSLSDANASALTIALPSTAIDDDANCRFLCAGESGGVDIDLRYRIASSNLIVFVKTGTFASGTTRIHIRNGHYKVI